WVFGDQPVPAYSSYEVYAAQNYIAIVKASVDELSQVATVDVFSRGFFGTYFNHATNFIQDDPIVCMQAYPGNPKWSMIVLRRSPFSGMWKGSIRVKNIVTPIAVPVIDNTFAHSGKSSLKISTLQTYKQ